MLQWRFTRGELRSKSPKPHEVWNLLPKGRLPCDESKVCRNGVFQQFWWKDGLTFVYGFLNGIVCILSRNLTWLEASSFKLIPIFWYIIVGELPLMIIDFQTGQKDLNCILSNLCSQGKKIVKCRWWQITAIVHGWRHAISNICVVPHAHLTPEHWSNHTPEYMGNIGGIPGPLTVGGGYPQGKHMKKWWPGRCLHLAQKCLIKSNTWPLLALYVYRPSSVIPTKIIEFSDIEMTTAHEKERLPMLPLHHLSLQNKV